MSVHFIVWTRNAHLVTGTPKPGTLPAIEPVSHGNSVICGPSKPHPIGNTGRLPRDHHGNYAYLLTLWHGAMKQIKPSEQGYGAVDNSEYAMYSYLLPLYLLPPNHMSDTTTTTATVDALYERGAHIGFSRSRRHPSVTNSLYGMKNRLDLIDLESTIAQIEAAKTFLAAVKASGKNIIVVGAKPEARDIVRRVASAANLPYVTERWIGGTLTNWSQVRARIEKMKKLKTGSAEGTLVYATKKERLMIDREIAKLETKFGGIEHLEATPGAVIIVDPKAEHICATECISKGVPVVAIANTDCNITNVTYPIVANDANAQVIHYILTQLTEGIK